MKKEQENHRNWRMANGRTIGRLGSGEKTKELIRIDRNSIRKYSNIRRSGSRREKRMKEWEEKRDERKREERKIEAQSAQVCRPNLTYS